MRGWLPTRVAVEVAALIVICAAVLLTVVLLPAFPPAP